MLTRKIMLLVILVVSIVAGCGQQNSQNDQEEIKIPVEVMNTSLGDVIQTLMFNGDIKAEFEVKVFSKIPDRIETLFVDEGDVVRKGDKIAQILATTIEQGVLQAEAGVLAAKAQDANMRVEFERAQRLYKESAMSRQQFDAIQTQYEAATAQMQQAEAALVSAKSALTDATITAPINGVIGNRYYEVGDMANPALPVVSIVQMDRVKISFDATEADLGKLEVGQSAEVTVRSYPDVSFHGRIIKISPVLDPLTRMATVEVLVENPGAKLKPGMYANVEITIGILQNVLVVPRHAVIENTSMVSINGKDQVVKHYFVYVVNDSSQAEQRKLNVNYVNHVQIAVDSGINVGEKLVVAGQNNLRDGLPVLIADNEEVE